jgi:GTPase
MRHQSCLLLALAACGAGAAALAQGSAGTASKGVSIKASSVADAANARGRRVTKRKEPPTIAVVGRPNVGKSTIANRMTQAFQRGGLVFDEPGVTRDRTYGYGFWGAHEFRVVDTGGLVFDDDEDRVFLPHIRQQAMVALGEAQVALLVVDGQAGRTALDEEIASFLRKQGVPVVLAVNKCESTTVGDVQTADFYSLGMGTPWGVSGLHGTGMGDVMDELVKPLPPPDEEADG